MTPDRTDRSSRQPAVLETINARIGEYATRLGIEFVEVRPDELVAQLEVGARHLQPYGLLHGGVVAGMVETVCSVGAALSVIDEQKSAVGLENTTSFLRAVRRGVLRATARPLYSGRRTQVWAAELHDEENRLVAVGRVRLLILEAGAHAGGSEITLEEPGSRD